MKAHLLVVLCASFLLFACTSSETRKQVSGSLDYLEVTEADVLKVPEELDRPNMSAQYELPEVAPKFDLIGTEVSIASPRLVLPLVNGTNVEEGSADARVLFDQLNDDEPLSKTVWDTVLSYLELNNIAVENFDQEANEMQTGWVVTREEVDTSWYDFTDEFTEEASRFKLSMELAPHGRTAALTADLVEYIDGEGNSQLSQLTPFELREQKVNFLNYIIAEYDVEVRLAQSQRIALIRDGFESNLGFNPDGDPAYIVDAVYGNAWPRLLLVLRKMGFDVIDLDQSSGLIFVQYGGADDSWWSGLFGSEELPIDKTDYRILVEEVGEKTSVTFKDSDNNPFEIKTVTDLFETFSDLMAQQNLDI